MFHQNKLKTKELPFDTKMTDIQLRKYFASVNKMFILDFVIKGLRCQNTYKSKMNLICIWLVVYEMLVQKRHQSFSVRQANARGKISSQEHVSHKMEIWLQEKMHV